MSASRAIYIIYSCSNNLDAVLVLKQGFFILNRVERVASCRTAFLSLLESASIFIQFMGGY